MRWLLLALLSLSASVAFAAPRVGVVTMQPGEIFWERFGHNALVVLDPDTGNATSYNFGFFDPGEPDFVARFVRGDMRYRLVALPFQQDMAIYRDEGRGVSVQWLEDQRQNGLGPQFAKLGRRVVYRKTDLDAFVAKRLSAVWAKPKS